MKRIVTLLIAVLLTFSMVSCAQNTTELSPKNIHDYINIQLVFGNSEQHIVKKWPFASIGISDDEKTLDEIYTSYTSCMCYIIVSPKADYKFENASLKLTLKQRIGLSLKEEWTINVYDSPVVYLDSRGYGIASVQITGNAEKDHPINYNFETSVISAAGSVYKAK